MVKGVTEPARTKAFSARFSLGFLGRLLSVSALTLVVRPLQKSREIFPGMVNIFADSLELSGRNSVNLNGDGRHRQQDRKTHWRPIRVYFFELLCAYVWL
jgi:hypothetical protein